MPSSAVIADIALGPSHRALHYLLPLHAAPLVAVPLFYRGDAVWPPLVLAALVGASWFYVRRHSALGFGRRALKRIVAHADGEWTVEDARGRQHAHLAAHTVVWGRIMLLNFRLDDGHKRSRLLLGDEAATESLRRLRAYVLSCRGKLDTQT